MARRGNNSNKDLATKAADAASDKVAGWVSLVVGVLISAFLYWRNHDRRSWMGFDEYNLLNTAMILWVPMVVIFLVLRREPSDFGFTQGDLGKGILTVLVLFLPFVVVMSFVAPTADSQNYYLNYMSQSRAITGMVYTPKGYSGGKILWERLAYHELVMGFYMFGWEWFFRGFLLFGMKRVMPVTVAVIIQAVLFMALHWGKPYPELISSFFGAIIMAVVALRFRSFLPCFVLHFLVSAGFDLAVLYFHFRK